MRDRKSLPSIHDAARLWFPSEADTLKACVEYRQEKGPGWSLTWLRDSAHHVLNNRLSEAALRQALKAHVPENAQRSVWNAVELLREFALRGGWQGIDLPSHDVEAGLGYVVRVRPIGMFYSPIRQERCLFGLQPRLEFAPDVEQDRIWLSALYYEFCCDPLEPLRPIILDLSGSKKTRVRDFKELSTNELSLLSKNELNERLDLIAKSYKSATELVPDKPKPDRPVKDTRQSDIFDDKKPPSS